MPHFRDMDELEWRRFGHIPVLIILQIIFIILFGKYVIYNPENAHSTGTSIPDSIASLNVYPMFQDVHVMIFIGFGFLMTFLKKYGLSAVSLNMLCASLSLQWATLVLGFFHFHRDHEVCHEGKCHKEMYRYPGFIFLDLAQSMLVSDFAAAAVLISFGVVIGKTSPLQLIVMTLIEIVLYVVNEVIGRKYIGVLDAGDTIFVHLFGAYFGLAASRVLYDRKAATAENQESRYTSDLFSMVGTIFLWMYWPSFNSSTALAGPAQHRAILNTYFSLTACVLATFSISALLNEHNKFVMEHIENATLAGGVAIGCVADMAVQPFGALIMGCIAGIVSTVGFDFVTPFLRDRLKVHDTCGVHNLHGMPALLGGFLSALITALAKEEQYGDDFYKIFPALSHNLTDEHGHVIGDHVPRTPSGQALVQLAGMAITLTIAISGGAATGIIMKMIGKWQKLEELRGASVLNLALNVGNISSGAAGMVYAIPPKPFFDDHYFFEVHEDEHKKKLKPRLTDSTLSLVSNKNGLELSAYPTGREPEEFRRVGSVERVGTNLQAVRY